MGLLDKIQNLFTDEVEEEPIKSEMIQVEIPAPAKVVEESISDNANIQAEEKPATPIFFDDDYFKELEKPKEVKSSYLKEQAKEKIDKRIFKPTPVISPVYGVLDKNYSKEDIRPKQTVKYETNTTITLDEVRKKAFGTLEDELETTLFGNNSILFNDETENKKEEIDLFDEVVENKEEIDLFDELKDETDPKSNLEEPIILEDEKKEDSELFDLIDSMYEKGE